MALAAYCTACEELVWLGEDGGCERGHPRSCLRSVEETQPNHVTGRPERVGYVAVPPRPYGAWSRGAVSLCLGLAALGLELGSVLLFAAQTLPGWLSWIDPVPTAGYGVVISFALAMYGRHWGLEARSSGDGADLGTLGIVLSITAIVCAGLGLALVLGLGALVGSALG